MASPPSPRQEPRSPLPAPYEDPWRRLANDLVAVVAAGGLKGRELWRLNGEGSLATPAFWPSSLAPLFWPFLLAVGLALLGGLGLGLSGWWGGGPGEAGAERSEAVSPVAPERGAASSIAGPPSASPSPGALQADQPRAAGDADAVPLSTTAETAQDTGLAGGAFGPPSSTDRGAGLTRLWPWKQGPGADQANGAADRPEPGKAGAGPAADPAADPTAGAPSGTMGGESSPLAAGDGAGAESAADNAGVPPPLPLAELVGADPPVWVQDLEERPAEGLLRLRLAGGYSVLPLAERRSLAERWLVRARELGYERLELVDPAGRTLGRPARVGSGMILLDALSNPP